MGRPRDQTIDAFFDKALHYDSDECLFWPFHLNRKGYAVLNRFWRYHGTDRVGRVICEKLYGPPPTDMHQAAHSIKCINRSCINGRHLRWATPEENSADRYYLEEMYLKKLKEQPTRFYLLETHK